MADFEPEPDARQDLMTRERITEVLNASIADRAHLNRHLKWVERAVIAQAAVLAIGLGLITGIPGITGGLLGANQDRIDDIQAERARNIERGCLDQNKRHDDTIAQLDSLLKLAIQQAPQRADQIRQSRTFTVALIEALAPHRDCTAVKAQQIPSASKG